MRFLYGSKVCLVLIAGPFRFFYPLHNSQARDTTRGVLCVTPGLRVTLRSVNDRVRSGSLHSFPQLSQPAFLLSAYVSCPAIITPGSQNAS